jgi:hypothetical protein
MKVIETVVGRSPDLASGSEVDDSRHDPPAFQYSHAVRYHIAFLSALLVWPMVGQVQADDASPVHLDIAADNQLQRFPQCPQSPPMLLSPILAH